MLALLCSLSMVVWEDAGSVYASLVNEETETVEETTFLGVGENPTLEVVSDDEGEYLVAVWEDEASELNYALCRGEEPSLLSIARERAFTRPGDRRDRTPHIERGEWSLVRPENLPPSLMGRPQGNPGGAFKRPYNYRSPSGAPG
jgi:hypothetical protein